MSQPALQAIKIERNVPIVMRDGIKLYADVFRPDDDQKHPVIVERVPYDRGKTALYDTFNPIRAASSGFVAVLQDCRGSVMSEGEFYPYREGNDGYDTVEWAAAQPWSNGKVGMAGMSYMAVTQWAAAVKKPPHLAAIFPNSIHSDVHDNAIFPGGAFQIQNAVNWAVGILGMIQIIKKDATPEQKQGMLAELFKDIQNMEAQYRHLPLNSLPALDKAKLSKFYYDWLRHPDNDEFWDEFRYNVYDQVEVPAYHFTGWYDISVWGTLENFLGMVDSGGNELARKNQKLLVGPWIHWAPQNSLIGSLDAGFQSAAAVIDITGIQLRWFDYWLKGIDNGIMRESPVKIFVMGDNVWRNENEWPLARTVYTNYYFHSGGKANSLRGDGVLSLESPTAEREDCFLYNPVDPVPTKGGCVLSSMPSPVTIGTFDQREIEERSDVLVYTSLPLEKDTEVTGPLTVVLYAVSSAPDTDFTAKLIDVWPGGQAYNIADGIIRARYRESSKEQKLIEPGKVYEYHINLWATSNVFKKGHRIRVDISSSNFPRFDRNPNNGEPFGTSKDFKVAIQSIFHNKQYPSHIVLPIIPIIPR